MNENGFLSGKDLEFIEALKEDHKINGAKSLLNTLFNFCDWVGGKGFQELLISIVDDVELVSCIDWVFSIGGGYVIGKYKKYFLVMNSNGEIFPYGVEIQNIIDMSLDYYSDFRSPEIEYRSFYSYHSLSLIEELEKYNVFCAKLGLTVNINENFDESQNEGFDYELFDNIFYQL